MPQMRPLVWYAAQPLPETAPRTIASSITGSALRTSIVRPMYSGPSSTGKSGFSVESITRIMWFGTTACVSSNQNADI